MSKAPSSRIKEAAQRRFGSFSVNCLQSFLCHRVLDDASRQRRARKALENLEQV